MPRPARCVRRAVGALAGLLSLVALGVLGAGPAAAAANEQLGPREGANLDSGLTNGEAFLYFVGGPAAVLLLIAAVVWLPGMARSDRYRPGRGWAAPPVWFAGPPEPVAAVEAATRSDAPRGGARGEW